MSHIVKRRWAISFAHIGFMVLNWLDITVYIFSIKKFLAIERIRVCGINCAVRLCMPSLLLIIVLPICESSCAIEIILRR